MIVLNSLFPIFVLLLLGWGLKQQGLTNADFLQNADRLIYYFFFPVMLFWKIGGSSFVEGIDWNFCFASLCALFTMFVLSTLVLKLFRISAFQAGSFSQSCYRFNTYIGVAIILNGFGTEGMKYFGILIGMTIPIVNVFAVSLLIWFSGREMDLSKRMSIAGKALVSNPLIIGCLAGIGYSSLVGWFPVFINNSLSLISMVALPLALISIGGSLTFAGVKGNLGLSFLAASLKLLLLPGIGWLFYYLFNVTGLPLKVGMVFFALPISTAIYVLSSQMNSDTDLASSAIVLSTLLSFFSLSFILLL
ncbi:MAG: AEC family transporter [Desulfobulbaceae bacterium]|nr:AEC family transporter [Desulfobulbaceae bacterium]